MEPVTERFDALNRRSRLQSAAGNAVHRRLVLIRSSRGGPYNIGCPPVTGTTAPDM